MDLIKGLVDIMLGAWSTLSNLKLDGVSWTSIMVAFLVFLIVVSGLIHARR